MATLFFVLKQELVTWFIAWFGFYLKAMSCESNRTKLNLRTNTTCNKCIKRFNQQCTSPFPFEYYEVHSAMGYLVVVSREQPTVVLPTLMETGKTTGSYP